MTRPRNRQKDNSNKLKVRSTEEGYFKNLYSQIRSSQKKSNRTGKLGWPCDIDTFEEFFDIWLKQKKKYGYKCPYTGVKMTRLVSTGYKVLPANRKFPKRRMTNISPDRLDSNRPYSADNIVFCTVESNAHKNKCSFIIMINVLRIMFEKTMKDIATKKTMNLASRFFTALKSLHTISGIDVEQDKIKENSKQITLQQESIKIPTLESFFK